MNLLATGLRAPESSEPPTGCRTHPMTLLNSSVIQGPAKPSGLIDPKVVATTFASARQP